MERTDCYVRAWRCGGVEVGEGESKQSGEVYVWKRKRAVAGEMAAVTATQSRLSASHVRKERLQGPMMSVMGKLENLHW